MQPGRVQVRGSLLTALIVGWSHQDLMFDGDNGSETVLNSRERCEAYRCPVCTGIYISRDLPANALPSIDPTTGIITDPAPLEDLPEDAPPRTLVFDLDGTLSDPLEGIANSINHALIAHGFDDRPFNQLKKYVGPPLDEIFRDLTGRTDPTFIQSCIDTYRERYAERGYAENTMIPGIDTVLVHLTQIGCTLGICTSKRQDLAEKIIAHFGWEQDFSFINGGDVGITKQQQLAHLLETKQIDQTAIMIGDRAVDIKAAHVNGLQVAGVTWGFASDHELKNANPDWLLNNPNDILAIVGVMP